MPTRPGRDCVVRISPPCRRRSPRPRRHSPAGPAEGRAAQEGRLVRPDGRHAARRVHRDDRGQDLRAACRKRAERASAWFSWADAATTSKATSNGAIPRDPLRSQGRLRGGSHHGRTPPWLPARDSRVSGSVGSEALWFRSQTRSSQPTRRGPSPLTSRLRCERDVSLWPTIPRPCPIFQGRSRPPRPGSGFPVFGLPSSERGLSGRIVVPEERPEDEAPGGATRPRRRRRAVGRRGTRAGRRLRGRRLPGPRGPSTIFVGRRRA